MRKIDHRTKKKVKQMVAAVMLSIAIKVLDVMEIDALWSDLLAFVMVLVLLGLMRRLLYPSYENAAEKKESSVLRSTPPFESAKTKDDDVPKSGTWKK